MTKSTKVKSFTKNRIHYLGAISETGNGKALLAQLRRGVGKDPGDLPALWGVFLEDMPDELCGYNGSPSNSEAAVYHSLTLFGLHQQGSDISSLMKADGISIGKAAALMVKTNGQDSKERIEKKLDYASRANTLKDLIIRLRALIQLLKQSGIVLDYSLLAEDLYRFSIDDQRREVRLKWGRDFYKELNRRKEDKENVK
ncbi:MAG: type I-E CRISPR-associated protein Cse2/CasB [Erysipelotrichaceae bacterium]|nr:type I-E CRISPR-associated protein Cse2/CasB [Erysipelotrichaceae bacterium]